MFLLNDRLVMKMLKCIKQAALSLG